MSSEVIERVESYSYSPIPPGTYDRGTWGVTVENTGDDMWAIRNGSRCLDRNLEWDHEPRPSSRTDEWLAQHRFTLPEAQRLARRVCHDVTWNGRTADDIAARPAAVDLARGVQ